MRMGIVEAVIIDIIDLIKLYGKVAEIAGPRLSTAGVRSVAEESEITRENGVRDNGKRGDATTVIGELLEIILIAPVRGARIVRKNGGVIVMGKKRYQTLCVVCGDNRTESHPFVCEHCLATHQAVGEILGKVVR